MPLLLTSLIILKQSEENFQSSQPHLPSICKQINKWTMHVLSRINPFICTINPTLFALFALTILSSYLSHLLYWNTPISIKACYSSHLKRNKKSLHFSCQLLTPHPFSLAPLGTKICERISYTLSPIPLLLFLWTAVVMITNSFDIAKANGEFLALIFFN